MKKVLFVFDEENVGLEAISEIKDMFDPENAKVTAVSYDDDFYFYAKSDYAKDRREASVKRNFSMIKSRLKDYEVEEERIAGWTAEADVLSIAEKKDADIIIIAGNTRKMRKLAKKVNKKSNIAVTLIPVLERKAA
ncbi:MAG: universal stress protein [Clostridia bacterium]|jgi:hypothetical protein|nr:universal stress protein [Clostridia bacterium]MCI2000813.1 universal stress protein [Clostridia bacterium]MCI2015395.1 universal stress protein [Clostridia bacterium]